MKTDLEGFSHELEPDIGPGAASYLSGILGALLGAIVGAIPLVLVGALTGLFSGWLGFLIGFAAVKGYTLFRGARKHGYAMAVVVLTSSLVVLASCALCALIYFSADPDVQRVADRWGLPVFQVAWSVLTDNVGLVLLSFALPIVVSGAGIFIARRKLSDYTQPELLQRAAQAAEQVLSSDSETSLYFADSAFRKCITRSNLTMMMPVLALYVLLIVFAILPQTSGLIERNPLLFCIPFLFLLIVLIFMLSRLLSLQSMEYCFARDSQGTLWRVRLQRLSAIPTYQFGSFTGLTVININKLTPAQISMAQASVLRAIQDVRDGHAYPGSTLTSLVVPLENLEIQKETRLAWRCTYTDRQGKRKKVLIGKAFPNFHPLDDRQAAPIPTTSAKPVVISFVLTLFLILLFMLAMVFLFREKPDDISQHTYAPFSLDGVTVAVDEGWEALENGIFHAEDGTQIYRVMVTSLGRYDPQDALDNLFASLEDSYTTFNSEAMLTTPHPRDGVSSDGVPYQYGTVGAYESKDRTQQCFFAHVFAPDKNLWIILQGYGDETDGPVIATQVKNMMDSITFQVGDRDYVSGNTYTAGDDGSQLCLKDDGSFYYYASAGDHSREYFLGSYDVYYGQKAFDVVASLTGYSLTEEELEEVLTTNMEGYFPGASTPLDILRGLDPDRFPSDQTSYHVCRDTFYAVILHNDAVVMEPGTIEELGHDTLYIGYYIPELELVDMINANTGAYHAWRYDAPTSSLDVEPMLLNTYVQHELEPMMEHVTLLAA